MIKLLIVCEEKYKAYGDYLVQLIGSDDDKKDTIVGVKDGEVSATVWTEKQYTDNSLQISSMQHVLFIGNTKLTKGKRTNMDEKFNKYGMKYCWLGKQAVLYVDEIVKKEEYDNFIKYDKSNNSNIVSKLNLMSTEPDIQ